MTTAETLIQIGRIDMLVDVFKAVCYFGGIILLASLINRSEN
jgi:hypothetical protein